LNDPNSIDRHVGRRLRQLRLVRYLDLEALSRAIGISQARLLQLEEGRERVTPQLMRRLSNVLEVRPSEFLSGFLAGETRAWHIATPASPEEEERQLLRDFARITDPKSRGLILALVAAHAEQGDSERPVGE
jgi:transcriptional regulator with XRE-family HTH domain